MLRDRFVFALLALPLAVACLAPACSSITVEATGGTTGAGTGGTTGVGTGAGAGGGAACPADVPQDGASCAGGAACHYPVPCCVDTIAACSGGHWQVTVGPCIGKTPAPGGCPSTLPSEGDPCPGSCEGPLTCVYGTCPGSTEPAASATCLGTWSITLTCPDAGGGDGGIAAGGACGQSADGGACAAGLVCCYPCGMPECTWTCATPCNPGDPACVNGCPEVP